jgi:hypothetical protein
MIVKVRGKASVGGITRLDSGSRPTAPAAGGFTMVYLWALPTGSHYRLIDN